MKTYAKYHNLLEKSDVLLSADALQNFTETGFECFNINLCFRIFMVCQLVNFSDVHINKRFSYTPHRYKQAYMNLYNEKKCKYLMYLGQVLNEEEKSI